MSRTVKGSKGPGADFWSRRPGNPFLSASSKKAGSQKWAKRLTAHRERQAARRRLSTERTNPQ